MSTVRIADDEKGITPHFFMHSIQNEAKTKKEKRPVFDDIEAVRIVIGADKYNAGVWPAHEIWKTQKINDENGFEVVEPVTYAMRFRKQYEEFKRGGPQSISGTPIAELSSLTAGKRLELKALNIHTVEALASLEGERLKMIGVHGRDYKNDAMAYLEKAASLAPLAAIEEKLSQKDDIIAQMQAKIDAMMGSSTDTPKDEGTVTPQTEAGFAGFEVEDLQQWLLNAGIEPDKRWGKARLLLACQEELAKTGKPKAAAA